MPLISVIVPVYNAEAYLNECVLSIIGQTYRDLEIILIDDGSSDSSPEICNRYAREDPRIRVIHQKNGGVSAARNAGLDLARGAYVGFVDSDDFIAPAMFENLLGLIKKHHASISMCRYREVRDAVTDKAVYPIKTDFPDGVLPAGDAIRKILVPGGYNGFLCNKLFDSRLFNGENPVRLDPAIFLEEDLLAVIQCMLKTSKIAYTAQPYYCYRFHRGSATSAFSQKSLTFFCAVEKIVSLLPPALSIWAKASCVNGTSVLLCEAYAAKNKEAISYLEKVKRKYLPDFQRACGYFSLRDRVRVWGTGVCPPLFCRIWNAMRSIHLFLQIDKPWIRGKA